jgi:hypothetical protein
VSGRPFVQPSWPSLHLQRLRYDSVALLRGSPSLPLSNLAVRSFGARCVVLPSGDSGFRAALADFLSWGFPKIPLHRLHAMRQVRARLSFEIRAWGMGMPPLPFFRSCRSSRLQRFTPHVRLQVYCALLPILGFSPFGKPIALAFCSLRAVYPSKLYSSSSSRTASPRPLSPLVVHV